MYSHFKDTRTELLVLNKNNLYSDELQTEFTQFLDKQLKLQE